MFVGRGVTEGRLGHEWPFMIALLAFTTLLPTVFILWFMNEAVSNERSAARQEVREAYYSQVRVCRERIRELWRERIKAIENVDIDRPASEIFAQIITDGFADSVIISGKDNETGYPSQTLGYPDNSENISGWKEAQRLEFLEDKPQIAAELYAHIAGEARDVDWAARALSARARCLVKSGDIDAAVEVLTADLAKDKFRKSNDLQGRQIQPAAMVRGLHLMSEEDIRKKRILRSLIQRLEDYQAPTMPSAQRLFLMKRVMELEPEYSAFPTFAAEETAAVYLESNPDIRNSTSLFSFYFPDYIAEGKSEEKDKNLKPSNVSLLWEMIFRDRKIIALFKHSRIISEVEALCRSHISSDDVEPKLTPPGYVLPQEDAWVSESLYAPLTGWRLNLILRNNYLHESAAGRQITLYIYIFTLFVSAIIIAAVFAVRYLTRRLKITRLKNDLIATVSHELKTPLSSVRMLVDTLLEGQYKNEKITREYLELIAAENSRLSRLIDNFLAFSRLERNKKSFQMQPVFPSTLIEQSIGAVKDKYQESGFRLDMEITTGLKRVKADPDALTTVLINLLDNAWKYSDNDKRVKIRAYGRDNMICFEVEDHGVGIPRRDVRKIFNRYYRMKRDREKNMPGCGLGLSIVKFIMEAHKGSITVKSRPGEGSTFTASLPAIDE